MHPLTWNTPPRFVRPGNRYAPRQHAGSVNGCAESWRSNGARSRTVSEGEISMRRSTRPGLTLVECLVVIALIAIVIGLLLPATRRVREADPRSKCANNLKQLIVAIHEFESTSGSDKPSGSNYSSVQVFPPGCFGPGSTPEERLSWMVALLPYLDQGNLYRQIDLQKGYQADFPAARTKIRMLLCPTSDEASQLDGVSNYIAMSGIGYGAAAQPEGTPGNGFMGYDRPTRLTTIKDGTSNTIALMETRSSLGPWARAVRRTCAGSTPPTCRSTATSGRSPATPAERKPRWPTAPFGSSAPSSNQPSWRPPSPSTGESRSTWTEYHIET
ncbi:hypothetical protein FRUB_01770 [Fimbriiglobus ruber]|uniref:DUF1559 domain-containing protein n=1 Tax=Fimbriiglobus ruber TaxID=1908690 RepID=A0A225E7F2_9BACT|nr:hypothetical protein FRUB_01770 [Fimbriiglobus ruber]